MKLNNGSTKPRNYELLVMIEKTYSQSQSKADDTGNQGGSGVASGARRPKVFWTLLIEKPRSYS